MTIKQTGRLTFRLFSKLYQHYKDTFDMEMKMQRNGITYRQLAEQAETEEEWF